MQNPIILYDGYCGFCNSTVRFLLRIDKQERLMFAPLQSEFGQAVIARHPELVNIDSIVICEVDQTGKERVAVKSRIFARLAIYLTGPWRLLSKIASLIPKRIRDALYDLIARNRYRFFKRFTTCPIPEPSVRRRFIDLSGPS